MAERATRDAKGRWRKGVTGNPGGRPRGLASLVRARTRDGQELVEFYLSVFRDHRAKLAHRMEAAEWLTDRGWGRPVQAVEHATEEGGPVTVRLTWADDASTA